MWARAVKEAVVGINVIRAGTMRQSGGGGGESLMEAGREEG